MARVAKYDYGWFVMNKGKSRNPENKYLSIVFVPHSSSQVKVLKFTFFYGKLIGLFLLLLFVFAGAGLYISRVIDENKGLRESITTLYSANAEQRKLLDEKSVEINGMKEKDETFNKDVTRSINDFTKKFNEITDKYISGQTGGKTSRSGDRNEKSFSVDINDLKTILDDLNKLYLNTDIPTVNLSEAEAKLDKYIETVPTLWPAAGHLSDTFGYRRDPFTRRKTFHEGLDIGAPYGTDIKAAASGKVTMAARYSGYGRAVIIDHGHGLSTLYGHTSKLLVKEGQLVKKGDVIAKVGSSGRSTGPHLHFEVRLYNTPVDPAQYLDAN